VFLWRIPLVAALLMAETTIFKAVFAPSKFLFATSNSTFLERVRNVFLAERFLDIFFRVCLSLFRTDLLFLGGVFAGNRLSSSMFFSMNYSLKQTNITNETK
jgi:hypothetical protein